MRRKDDIGVLLKGDIKQQCGISLNLYACVHHWLKRKFGVANKCENPDCQHKTSIFHWALIKGKQYEKKRENFMMLCISCHMKYDWDEEKHKVIRQPHSPEALRKIAFAQIGRVRTTKELAEASKRMSGELNPMYGVRLTKEQNHFYGKKHTEDSITKMRLSSAKLSQQQVVEIRNRHKNGEKQNAIAKDFGLPKSTVCLIVNHKRYKQW